MKKSVFAGVVFGSWLACGATGLSAQPIEPAVPRSITDYFEQACARELADMNASWADIGQNGPDRHGIYESVSELSADDVRQRFQGYDFLPRRSETPQDRRTNEWEDCLLNARLRQLGESPVARPPQPDPPPDPTPEPPVTEPDDDQTSNEPAPDPDPGAPAELVVDSEGRERYVMPDGRDCVVIQSGQERVPNEPGAFNQTLTAKNRCNIPITVRACAPDGTCFDIATLANSSTTQVVGTSQGLIADWQPSKLEDMGDDGQFGPAPVSEEPYQEPPYQGGSDIADNSDIDFGNDSNQWANDGECDDPRFSGPGAASEPLAENVFRDASDCRRALAAGNIEFTGYADQGGSDQIGFFNGLLDAVERGIDIYSDIQDINDQGNDTGTYSNDGEYGDEDDGDDCNYNSDGDPTTVCTVQ